jgi:hypothetical protein
MQICCLHGLEKIKPPASEEAGYNCAEMLWPGSLRFVRELWFGAGMCRTYGAQN